MTDRTDEDTTDEEPEREYLDLERNSLDEVGAKATAKLSSELKHSMASFVVRAGLGPVFFRIAESGNHADPSLEEIGALMAISSFDPDEDPIMREVWDDLYREATGQVVLTPEAADEIADHLIALEEALLQERGTGDTTVEETDGGEWASELHRRAVEARRP